MSKPSRSPGSHSVPLELVAELDELCVEREQARGASQGLGGAFREQRIQELQTALLEYPPPVPGSILAGATLDRVLQVGSFATRWRATRLDTGLECAVHVFHANCAARGRMLHHFRQGIGALRALTAAGAPASIVRFYAADDSQLAFSTALVPGTDLNDIARRGWSLDKKMQVFSGVCAAVKFAHDRGILHRDLCPENVLYDERAEGPVLTDFDLADVSELGAASSSSRWSFAAPEQRQPGRDRLRESDVYSLGRLLQYLLTEQAPGAGTGPAISDATIAGIIATCTRDEPGQRYGDVEEIQTEIRRWRSGLSVSAARQSVHPPAPVPPQQLEALTSRDRESLDRASKAIEAGAARGRLWAWAAVLGVLAGAGAFAWSHRSELGWGSAVAPPAPAPDAGPAPARPKKPRPKKRATSERSGPTVNLSDAISRLFNDNSAAFHRCHSGLELPADELRGRVTTRFKVDADGVLSEARLAETTIKAPEVARCIVATHNGLRLYKRPGQPTSGQSRYEIE